MNNIKPDEVIAGNEAKGKPLSSAEREFALSYLTRLSYRIRHSDPQFDGVKMTASYYIGQSLMNVNEYLATHRTYEESLAQFGAPDYDEGDLIGGAQTERNGVKQTQVTRAKAA